jgi:hypothetical protein
MWRISAACRLVSWRRAGRVAAAFVLLAAAKAGPALAQVPELKTGDPAPPFALAGTDGRVHALSDHLGIRPVVLAWFPRVFATL